MILVIDDDLGIRASLSLMLRRAHYDVTAVATAREAMDCVRREEPQLIMLDMNLSPSTTGDDGLTLLKQIRLFRPRVPVVLMTAWGSIELAVKGMRAGAADFVTKPWNNAALMERIETALAMAAESSESSEHSENSELSENSEPSEDSEPSALSPIIGRSPQLRAVLDTVRRVAPTNAPVLITGESGTGKELIAEAIHRLSRRSTERFVKVNLGGISQSLFESEMFGYRKGAFTGAVGDRAGRFELADRGTIFLDEIGDLDAASQVKLLRVLQDQTYEPLGDSHTRHTDVRVVSATNADLPQLISEGRFREDLFYRINLITLHLPALRERKDDIPILARHFADCQCRANQLPPVAIADEAIAALQAFAFPGNIRQLKNIVERALLLCEGGVIRARDLGPLTDAPVSSTATLNLEEQERATIQKAYADCDGNISHMAEALGLSRAALYRRLEKYGLR